MGKVHLEVEIYVKRQHHINEIPALKEELIEKSEFLIRQVI